MVASNHASLCHPDGWRQIAFNFSSILILGTLVERLFGAWQWLGLYFVVGFVGELAGYAWKPVGAGASVAGAGLLGAIALWLILGNRTTQAAIGGVIILVGGTILTVTRDIHGPPILAGALMAWSMRKEMKESPCVTSLSWESANEFVNLVKQRDKDCPVVAIMQERSEERDFEPDERVLDRDRPPALLEALIRIAKRTQKR